MLESDEACLAGEGRKDLAADGEDGSILIAMLDEYESATVDRPLSLAVAEWE